MKAKSFTIVLAVLIMALLMRCSAGSAGRAIPPSNETSNLYIIINATAVGSLSSSSGLAFTQGNGNLIDNPPLEAGEGQATLGYDEKTIATSGSITYGKILALDTDGQGLNDLLVVRDIDYANTGDGDGMGMMYSAESVMIDECVSASTNTTTGCCQWPTDTPEDLAGSCVYVISGSEVLLEEGSVTSVSKANIVSDVPNAGVSLGYVVDVGGSGQTGNATAVGMATVYTEALIMEGSGNATNMTTKVEYDESVTVNGLITIAMNTGYFSSNI